MRRFIIPVVIVAALAILSAIISGASPTEAQGNSPPAANVQVVNGPTPGTVIVHWDAVPEATHYGIGYVNLLRDHPQAKAGATGNWRETFGNGFVGDRVALQAPATDCSGDDYDRDEWGEYPGADADAVPTWTLPSDDVASAEITLDHHVALKDAHVSGGCDWIVAMKNDFAADPANLNPTTRSFNSSKGSRTPDQLTGIAQRIIDTEDEQCDYATQHDEVKDKYDLSMTESERETVTQWLALCQGEDSGDSVTPQTPATNPGVATDVSVGPLNSGGTLQVNWTKAANATGYIVIAVNTANVADVGATPVNGGDIETANISGLTVGATYDIYVVATAKGGFAFPDAAVQATAASASTPVVTPMPGLTLPLPTPTQTFPASAVGGDYDHDNDGLIEVRTLAQLNAIRLDLLGTSLVYIDDLPKYLAAFPGALDDMGCPAEGCTGYELAANLDFDTNGNGEADEGDDYWNDGAGWEPLTRRLFSHNPYRPWQGTFDGNHYTISNLYINLHQPLHAIGLFADNIGTIRNVNLVGVDITVQRDLYADRKGIGSLAGYTDATITGCSVSGRVSGINDVGGLVGSNDQDISDSQANVTVSGNNNVGGLVGKMADNATIVDSSALGEVSGSYYVGGLVGYYSSSLPITNSSASGNVTGKARVGGLVGGTDTVLTVINNSFATGDVTGEGAAGGLVGDNIGSINNSFATGDVTGEGAAGGLAGSNTGPITNSRATGAVSGQDRVGGLVGRNSGDARPIYRDRITRGVITNSTATGTVMGNDRVGGLIGDNFYGNIHSVTAQGQVTGRFYVGGLVGRHAGTTGEHFDPPGVRGLIENSTASGNVIGVRWRGPLFGTNEGGTITNSTGTGTVSSPQ